MNTSINLAFRLRSVQFIQYGHRAIFLLVFLCYSMHFQIDYTLLEIIVYYTCSTTVVGFVLFSIALEHIRAIVAVSYICNYRILCSTSHTVWQVIFMEC